MLLAAIVATCIRSYWMQDNVAFESQPSRGANGFTGYGNWWFVTGDGSVFAMHEYHFSRSTGVSGIFGPGMRYWNSDTAPDDMPYFGVTPHWGFGFLSNKWQSSSFMFHESQTARFPIWVPAILVIPFPAGALIAVVRSRRIQPRMRCASCGYNLTANTSGVCPECGTPLPVQQQAAA